MKTLNVLCCSLAIIALCGCNTTPPPAKPGGVYTDPDDMTIVTKGMDNYDYNLVLKKTVQSMLHHGLKKSDGSKPVIAFAHIYNHTPYNIETRMMQQDIRIDVMKSGVARFTSATDVQRKGGEAGVLWKQLQFQADSGLVDPATAAAWGKVVGADYVLHGDIYLIGNQATGHTENTYRFLLSLTEVKTGLVVWSDRAVFRKNFR
jgi:uncharacterized protein (TIGR02722 family)